MSGFALIYVVVATCWMSLMLWGVLMAMRRILRVLEQINIRLLRLTDLVFAPIEAGERRRSLLRLFGLGEIFHGRRASAESGVGVQSGGDA
jgi:hypothetical protein